MSVFHVPSVCANANARAGSAPWPPARAWCTGDGHVDCAALGPADSRPVSDTSSAPSTSTGLRRAASPRPRPAHGRRSVGRRAHRGRAHARIRTAPGRALDGTAGARESASDDGRRSPATPPALGTPAPTPTCTASGWAAISSAFRVRGSIPAARLLFPVRPRSCARCAARAPGEPLSPRARAPSHPAGCVHPALRRASSGPTPEANPCAAPCAKPSDGSCTTPRGEAVDPPHRAAYSAPPPQGSAADTAR